MTCPVPSQLFFLVEGSSDFFIVTHLRDILFGHLSVRISCTLIPVHGSDIFFVRSLLQEWTPDEMSRIIADFFWDPVFFISWGSVSDERVFTVIMIMMVGSSSLDLPIG